MIIHFRHRISIERKSRLGRISSERCGVADMAFGFTIIRFNVTYSQCNFIFRHITAGVKRLETEFRKGTKCKGIWVVVGSVLWSIASIYPLSRYDDLQGVSYIIE